MFVPRSGRNETLIPLGAPTPAAERPPERVGAGDTPVPEAAHPAHVYETGAHATGVVPDSQQPGGVADMDAYVAAADTAGPQTAAGVGGLTEAGAGGSETGLARD